MYFLKENVYIVTGAKKDCIYDLNNGKLYHIDKKITDLIYKAGLSNSHIFQKIEFDTLKELETLDLIECKSSGQNSDISSIKIENKIKMAWIEVCDICNLFCIHCYNESSPKCNNMMSLEDFKMVCDKIYDYGVRKIQIIGGEPFCNVHILEMLSYAQELWGQIEVFTNATLLTEDIVKFLRDKNIKVAISIYSYIPEEHDKITRVKGSHRRTTESIELLSKYGVNYRTSNILMDGLNLGLKNAEQYDLQNYRCVIKMAGRGNVNLLNKDLMKHKMITPVSFKKKIYKELISENISGHPCFGRKIYITSTLDVYPCPMERRVLHGNLKNHSLQEILKPDILLLSKDKISECQDCEFRYACRDCRPDSYTGNIKEKPYFCTYDVYNGKWRNLDKAIEDTIESIMLS